jgi:hypothetical protein
MNEIDKQLDTIVEDLVAKGYIIKDVPADLLAALKEAHDQNPEVQVFERVRFTKLTPRKKRFINEVVIQRYHKDLQNKELLSNEQLRKINSERGEWTTENEAKLRELQDKSAVMMRDLYLDGIDRREEWLDTLMVKGATYRGFLTNPPKEHVLQLFGEAKDQALEVFDRWSAFSTGDQAEYDTKYAPSQNRVVYSPEADMQKLMEYLPEALYINLLSEIDELRYKLIKYTDLVKIRRELVELQLKQARIFAESVESRRDSAEELAKLYYTTDIVDDKDAVLGPIATSYDKMWDIPDEIIQWLLIELYFFINGIPEEARKYLSEWGFIRAPQASGAQPSSEELPEVPNSNSDSPPVKATRKTSSGSKTVTNSENSSSP